MIRSNGFGTEIARNSPWQTPGRISDTAANAVDCNSSGCGGGRATTCTQFPMPDVVDTMILPGTDRTISKNPSKISRRDKLSFRLNHLLARQFSQLERHGVVQLKHQTGIGRMVMRPGWQGGSRRNSRQRQKCSSDKQVFQRFHKEPHPFHKEMNRIGGIQDSRPLFKTYAAS